MKDLKITAAAFVAAMLIIPYISMVVAKDVQYGQSKYSKAVLAPIAPETTPSDTEEVFRVFRTASAKVEEIPAEEYICGVVAAEIPASSPEEALKAQAVAAFTYACYKREINRGRPSAASSIGGADLSDDSGRDEAYLSKQEAQQKWGPEFRNDWGRISAAVDAVKNKVITYNGKPIEALFFSCSGGTTESSENVWGDSVPYLQPVSSEWDLSAPDYSRTVVLTEANFKKKAFAGVKGLKFDRNPEKWLTGVMKSPSGTVLSASLAGKTVSGNTLEKAFALPSANFTASYGQGKFTFAAVGHGHCVGMSQYGAEYLARQGKSYEEIVKYYYTGVSVQDYGWSLGK